MQDLTSLLLFALAFAALFLLLEGLDRVWAPPSWSPSWSALPCSPTSSTRCCARSAS